MYVLEARGLSRDFGGFKAVASVDFGLVEGSIHAVIGPNGAGKTTLFNLLTKFLPPTGGTILHKGEDVTRLSPPAMARRGVVRSFQISAVFAGLTVRENVELALLNANGLAWNLFGSLSRRPALKRAAEEMIERFGLSTYLEARAGNLPYGRKRALELATTLALNPAVLLLDEPMAGLGHEDIDKVSSLVREAGRGRTILLVEHNMRVVSDLADTITVMVRGEKLAEGTYDEVSARPDVIAAYTGGAHV
ncbi:ABC transporter ATP-binding protein [Aquabacter sp. L1I39]|uniref:ABC transporter ATP-binding protein n=1 Tax=Aquabacter sp. L1I39 TaxID=2820278 RepID=UPI001AD96CB8|nr:ABC transporter ATP-binding protein [Aquabacter sp. L1I39]QTL04976.1 ABC transporter ATP-binding protein [Aquabacter sp. L1I39]